MVTMSTGEAIKRIEDHMKTHRIGEYPHLRLAEALNMALAALRAQQTPAKLDRSRWEGCGLCKGAKNIYGSDITAFCGTSEDGTANIYTECEQDEMDFEYCPNCGRPLTEEAWAELEWRISGVRENS